MYITSRGGVTVQRSQFHSGRVQASRMSPAVPVPLQNDGLQTLQPLQPLQPLHALLYSCCVLVQRNKNYFYFLHCDAYGDSS